MALGYVGLPLAVEFGKKRPVMGFDINAKRIAELQAGHDNTLETEPEELRAARHLRFTSHLGDLRHSQADIGKARRLLGYAPTHSIGQGVQAALGWYVKNQSNQAA